MGSITYEDGCCCIEVCNVPLIFGFKYPSHVENLLRKLTI